MNARQTAQEALQAVRSVAVLAEEVRTPSRQNRLGAPVRLRAPRQVEVPVVVIATFEQAVTLLTVASYQDVEPEVFQTLGRASRHAEAALVEEINTQAERVRGVKIHETNYGGFVTRVDQCLSGILVDGGRGRVACSALETWRRPFERSGV